MRLIWALLLTSAFCLKAEIIEVSSLNQVLNHTSSNTFLFCELDEILLKNDLISTQKRFYHRLKKNLRKEGYEPDQLTNKVYLTQSEVLKHAKNFYMPHEASSFLSQLIKEQTPLVTLSDRGPDLALVTLDQLHHQPINLMDASSFLNSQKAFEDQWAVFSSNLFLIHPICSKGSYLVKFVEYYELKDREIYFVSQDLCALVEAQHELEKKGIKYKGFHYQEKVDPLSEQEFQMGQLQLKYLNQILPDSVAQILAEKQTHDTSLSHQP